MNPFRSGRGSPAPFSGIHYCNRHLLRVSENTSRGKVAALHPALTETDHEEIEHG